MKRKIINTLVSYLIMLGFVLTVSIAYVSFEELGLSFVENIVLQSVVFTVMNFTFDSSKVSK